jgi:hypothetical protein
VATPKRRMYFSNILEADFVGNMDFKRDIKGGKLSVDRKTSKNSKK